MALRIRCKECGEMSYIVGIFRKEFTFQHRTAKWMGLYVCKNEHESEYKYAAVYNQQIPLLLTTQQLTRY